MSTARDAPCPCGSGMKYKHSHSAAPVEDPAYLCDRIRSYDSEEPGPEKAFGWRFIVKLPNGMKV